MDSMLRALSDHTGNLDAHSGTAAALQRDFALFRALMAERKDAPAGLVLFFPHYSTLRGMAGLYVQDLFVAPVARGRGLGRALLAAAGRQAAAEWGARYLVLSADRGNDLALGFYRQLGFKGDESEVQLALEQAGFTGLIGEARA